MILAFPHTRLIASPFYTEYLEEIPDEVALAILPRNRQFDKEYMYQQTLHGHKMVNGTVSRHTQEIIEYIAQNPLLLAGSTDLGSTTLPRTSHSLAMMADAGIGYLVLDRTHIEETSEWKLGDWRQLIQGEPVYEDELLLVYAISPEIASDHE